MSDSPSSQNKKTSDVPPVPPPALGGDRRSGSLKGIAPAVVSAFLNRADGVQPAATPPPSTPTSTPWPEVVEADVRARRLKLDHLAMMLAARSPQASPPARGGTEHLGRRQTMDLAGASAAGNMPAATRRLNQLVEQTLGFEGVVALHRAVHLLEDRAIPERLSELGERVNALIPAPDEAKRLGAEVGKRLLVDNVDPVLALSMATKESAAHFERLKDWESLDAKARLLTTTGLTASLAEIVGVVSPPPINVGAQLASVGLQLVALATEHSESIEGVTQKVKRAETTRRAVGVWSEQRSVLAHRLEEAWTELAVRLARGPNNKRRLALLLQWREVFETEIWLRFNRQRQRSGWVLALEGAIIAWLKRLRG